jgi:Bifunctional DNA primase/polymerase, N-terminal/Domain of unknown function (DUF927)
MQSAIKKRCISHVSRGLSTPQMQTPHRMTLQGILGIGAEQKRQNERLIMSEYTTNAYPGTSQNPLLDAAEAYAARGWRVIPLWWPVQTGNTPVCACSKGAACGRNVGKHPIVDDWPEAATTDPASIQAWWQRHPYANVGIVAGCGLVNIDIDPRNGGQHSLEDLEATYGKLPDTPLVQTGGGGEHRLFSTTEDLPSGKLGPGIDFLADDHHQFVAAPSLHLSGRRYVWELSSHPDDLPLAPLPAWVAALARSNAAERAAAAVTLPEELPQTDVDILTVPARIKAIIRRGAPQGQRSDALWSVLKALVQARYDDATIAGIVMDSANGISEKVLEQKNARSPRYLEMTKGWVAKEIARARAKPDTPWHTKACQNPGTPSKNRPGDVLDRTVSAGWWHHLLAKHGWTLDSTEDDGTQHWRCPCQGEHEQPLGVLAACGKCFTVTRDAPTPLQRGTPHSAFAALALLDHGGDFRQAAHVLMVQQFAEEWPEATDLLLLLEAQATAPDVRAVFDAVAQFVGLDRSMWGSFKRVLKALLGDALNLSDLEKAVKQARRAARASSGSLPPGEDETLDDGDRVGPYQATRTGLVWWKPIADGAVKVALTNFTARIVGDVVEDDGAETRRYFELEACHEGCTVCFPVEAAHFAGMSWALEHLGARAMVFPGITLKDHARAAVQTLSQNVHKHHIYTHLGWRQMGDRWCYLHAGGALGPEGPLDTVEVNARHSLAAYVLPPLPSIQDQRTALHASLRVLDTADAVVTFPLYAAIWRAVLGNADFSLHLVGPTGAGKSELAALVQQHYGAGMTARHLPAAWTSTGNALEGLSFEAKDVVLVVDDFCPSGSQADIARFHKDADRILRAQGNHSGRQRMKFDGTLRAVKPPRGLIVSTGEDTPQGQSLRARLLILDIAPGSVDWAKLSPCQTDAANAVYAQTLTGFVQWLAPHYERVRQGLHAEMIPLRQAALSAGHRRTPEIIGNLALGMQYFLAYAHAIDALSPEACADLWQRSWTALCQAAETQSEHQANEEPVRRFLALLTGTLAAGPGACR